MCNSKKRTILIPVTIGSLFSVGFGIWHFFIPNIWDWYSCILPDATELVLAVKAINFFFSLLLVLLGVVGFLLVFKLKNETFPTVTVLSMLVILWASRVIFQVLFPQGSQNPAIQYTMLGIFILVLGCYAISLVLFVFSRRNTNF